MQAGAQAANSFNSQIRWVAHCQQLCGTGILLLLAPEALYLFLLPFRKRHAGINVNTQFFQFFRLLIPLCNIVLRITKAVESIPPRIRLNKMTNTFLGLTGFSCVTAESIIRTLPTTLALLMLSSCCLFSSCIYTSCPASTSRVKRNISCWVLASRPPVY